MSYLGSAIAQAFEQQAAIRLRQGLPAGHTDVRGGEFTDLVEDGVDVMPITGVKCVFGIAVMAAQGATGQAHEHRA